MSDITGVSSSTTLGELCAAMGSSSGINAKAVAKNANAVAKNANATPAKKDDVCYYTFTGDLCPGPSFDQCPSGSRCDIDVGACVSAPRNDCISDPEKRGALPEGAGPQNPGDDGTAGNGGGRRRYTSKKARRSRRRQH